jgi:hypothetical protein
MKTLTTKEQQRLLEHAALTLNLSHETRPEILRKHFSEFTRDLITSMSRKRHIKHWKLVLIVDAQGEKS